MCMSCTNLNAETSRTCTKRAPCPACWAVMKEAMEVERERYCDDEDAMQAGDDSDIDPPFDYSAPEDDSDRNGGEWSGYEPPEVQ